MPTKITIEYDDGNKQEFVATPDLEAAILAGEMFSVSTAHPKDGPVEEFTRMYVGNPMQALGEMVVLYRAIDVHKITMRCQDAVGKCIRMLSNQITPRVEKSKEMH